MPEQVRPTYQAIVDQAVLASGAACGWLLVRRPHGLVVTATSGPTDPALPVGSVVGVHGARGFTLSADQPTALVPSPFDDSNRGIGGYAGVPPSLLVAAEGGAVLEVADKAGGGAFSFDDIEAISAFAQIAGSAALEHDDAASDAPTPAELAGELSALASSHPARYREIARVLEALLATQR